MIAVRVMQASVYKVVDVVTVRYGLVSAIRAMRVIWALGSRSALRRIRGIDREDMLVNMIPMHVVEMAVMNIVDVAIMADRRMAAGRSVLMGMVGMVLLGTGGHDLFLLFPRKCELWSHFYGSASRRQSDLLAPATSRRSLSVSSIGKHWMRQVRP
jgi:hypothetical protein